MRVIDLGGGHDEDYNDEIYDRRGGRGRSRRSDGTYMGYGGEYMTIMARSMTVGWMS